MEWAKDLDVRVLDLSKERRPVDVLWLVGCYPSYYPRNQLVARAFARLLTQLGVTWGVLGVQEKAIGECDRMFGEEGLFEKLVEDNRKVLDKQDFHKLVVLDPHAFHSLMKYYPRFDAWYPVQHYTTFLADRLEQLKPLIAKPVEAVVTYHDNCCLGRRSGCYDPPRSLLELVPGVKLVEMDRNRDNALCCGGGGGGMWLDAHIVAQGGQRLSDQRVAQAAADRGRDPRRLLPLRVGPLRGRRQGRGAGRAAAGPRHHRNTGRVHGFGRKERHMNIAVVVRQVPDLIEPLEIDSSGAALDLSTASFLVNESDDHALEQAILLKEAGHPLAGQATVSVVALDFGDVDNTLYTAAGKGADRIVKLSLDGEPPAPRAAAALYAEALKPLEPDLVLVGVQAHDELDGGLSPFLAAALGLPYIGVIRGVRRGAEAGTITVCKEFPGAVMAQMNVKLPALLGIVGAEQPPRYVPVAKIRAAMKVGAVRGSRRPPPRGRRRPFRSAAWNHPPRRATRRCSPVRRMKWPHGSPRFLPRKDW